MHTNFKTAILETSVSKLALTGRSIVSILDLDRAEIELILSEAEHYQRCLEGRRRLHTLGGRVLATLFSEPSTRTRLSFESAMHRLGGSVISTPDGHQTSSAAKGESIADTIRTVTAYCDVIVQRHPAIGSAAEAVKYAKPANVPVINGGDGAGEHPTQAMLDLYTMRKERGTLDGLHVAMVGDLKHGRTVHSLLHALSLWVGKVARVSPESLRMPAETVKELTAGGTQIFETDSLEKASNEADVLYMTRVQKERFADVERYEELKDSYIVDAAFMHRHHHLTLMHPLPPSAD